MSSGAADLLHNYVAAKQRIAERLMTTKLAFIKRQMAASEMRSALDLLKQHRADEVMSQPALTIREDATLSEAVRLMFERRVKRLPVVDAQGRLAGIVDRQSILKAMVSWGVFLFRGSLPHVRHAGVRCPLASRQRAVYGQRCCPAASRRWTLSTPGPDAQAQRSR